jgi:hypothetical protein
VKGSRRGLRLYKWTILYVLIFALPRHALLMVMQLGMSFIAERMRPEMVVVLIGLYATLISLATYLTYAAAARLHWASQMEDA